MTAMTEMTDDKININKQQMTFNHCPALATTKGNSTLSTAAEER